MPKINTDRLTFKVTCSGSIEYYFNGALVMLGTYSLIHNHRELVVGRLRLLPGFENRAEQLWTERQPCPK